MIYPVKELFQIQIDHPPSAILHVGLCLLHCLPRIATRSEAIAGVGELGLIIRREMLLDGLLDQPVYYRRDTQYPSPAIRLGDFYLAYRLRDVVPLQ